MPKTTSTPADSSERTRLWAPVIATAEVEDEPVPSVLRWPDIVRAFLGSVVDAGGSQSTAGTKSPLGPVWAQGVARSRVGGPQRPRGPSTRLLRMPPPSRRGAKLSIDT